ncbi:MAG TPA: DUF4112 domain-containing protein [Planctomycetaceae bacterium]|nr:hypothetical protein [Rubinisphaera sp.]HCS54272.1 DUF4112 domain-containing protein [Planctomycetaceae bacterium]|tara:strand:- start:948 stop:1421 length:474 start_codon:yes stop_codon:yes gene_type:complete
MGIEPTMNSTPTLTKKGWQDVKDRFADLSSGNSKVSSLLSQDQERVLRTIGQMEYWLDDKFRLPGTSIRFGWDTIIGLVPGVGDAVTAALALYIVWNARSLNIGRWTQFRMISNILFDTVLGAVPLVGDMFDVAFRANRKNLKLIMKELDKRKTKQV